MGNKNLTIDMITFKALDILEMNSPLLRNIDKQYDPSYAVTGAKIGSQLRIRKPDRCLVSDGATLVIQDAEEEYTTLTIDRRKHIGLQFTSAELALDIDDFAERKLKPRVSQLSAAIEADIAKTAYEQIYQSVGTPGQTPSTSQVLLKGNQKLNEMNVPLDMRRAVVNPAANAELVEGMKGLFNPGGTIDSQFKTGMMGANVLGFDEVTMGQGISTFTRAATGATAPKVTATMTVQGSDELGVTFTSGTPTFKKGDVFTIAGVYSVNPQSRVSTGSLQQFLVTADTVVSTAGTTATLPIAPPIYTKDQTLATVDSFPVKDAAITFMGTAGESYPQNLLFQKGAMTFASADLLLPKGVEFASRQQHNGISIRIVKQYDINADVMPIRLDILYTTKVLRPEFACRLWG